MRRQAVYSITVLTAALVCFAVSAVAQQKIGLGSRHRAG
jgi:hypothetical protein